MLQEGMEKHKFISEAQCLRDMQHKADSEYQAYLRRQEHKRGPAEKKQEQVGAQETNSERSRFPSGSSSKQSVGEEDLVAEPRLSAKTSLHKCDSRLPAIDQTSVKQKHKSTMTPKKPEKAGPSKPSSGDSSEHPLFCVEYSPYCTVLALSPITQPQDNYCCLLLPIVPPISTTPQNLPPSLPPFSSPSFTSYPSSTPGPVPQLPATLCYFPISSPSPAETPVLCLPGPRRPSKIYLIW
ncbi:putative E3 ubiquitin-protein ligase MARCHF10 [Rhynchocyon petersi]